MNIEKDAELMNLMSYLQEEFQSFPDVRIRLRQVATTQKSPDLEQDYDPETHDLHRVRGINVSVGSREFFFPSDWASVRNRAAVDREIETIKNFLGR